MSNISEDQPKISSAIVVDTGSFSCKIGTAGSILPQHEIPMVVGRSKYPQYSLGTKPGNDVFVGEEVHERFQILNVNYPLSSRSLVSNWDDLEHVWCHAFFSKMKVDPRAHPVLLTETTSFEPKATREHIAEIMFNSFGVPALFVCHQAILSLYATKGKISGCVIDIGHTSIDIVPVYEGFILSHAIQHVDIGGRDITEYLNCLLKINGKIGSSIGIDLIQDMKENTCFVSCDTNSISSATELSYECPDGIFIKIKSERAQCCEAFFNPKLISKKMTVPPLHTQILNSLSKCQDDVQECIAAACILVGASSLFPGMPFRLEQELYNQLEQQPNLKESYSYNVVALSNREFSSWTGGSLIASLATFQALWVTRQSYQQLGPSVLHEKCFF